VCLRLAMPPIRWCRPWAKAPPKRSKMRAQLPTPFLQHCATPARSTRFPPLSPPCAQRGCDPAWRSRARRPTRCWPVPILSRAHAGRRSQNFLGTCPHSIATSHCRRNLARPSLSSDGLVPHAGGKALRGMRFHPLSALSGAHPARRRAVRASKRPRSAP